MPIKSENEIKLGAILDGKFNILTELPGLDGNNTVDDVPEDNICFTTPLNEMKIHIVYNRNVRRFMRSMQRLFYTPSNKSNNWLRMHGYPMIRKAR